MALDVNYIKSNFDFARFTDMDTKILTLFCFVLLKNANNLILELGTYSFWRFLQNESKEILNKMGSSEKEKNSR